MIFEWKIKIFTFRPRLGPPIFRPDIIVCIMDYCNGVTPATFGPLSDDSSLEHTARNPTVCGTDRTIMNLGWPTGDGGNPDDLFLKSKTYNNQRQQLIPAPFCAGKASITTEPRTWWWHGRNHVSFKVLCFPASKAHFWGALLGRDSCISHPFLQLQRGAAASINYNFWTFERTFSGKSWWNFVKGSVMATKP